MYSVAVLWIAGILLTAVATGATEECSVGQYGANCTYPCSQDCLNQRCDHITGRCESCPTGRYGYDCSKPCSFNCGGAGKFCDRESGECDFDCNPGYWGHQCLNECNKNCDGDNNACKRYSGVCYSCDPGYYGKFCKIYCSKNCGGKDKSCEQITGACDEGCLPGYKQPTCEQAVCDAGYYGKGCNEICSEHCAGEKNICNQVNGTCTFGCDPGYYGLSCRKGSLHEKWEFNLTVWAVTATVIAVAATVIIGLLVWKLRSRPKGQIRKSSNNDASNTTERESRYTASATVRQGEDGQDLLENRRSDQYYESVGIGSEFTVVHDATSAFRTGPEDMVNGTRVYEELPPLTTTVENTVNTFQYMTVYENPSALTTTIVRAEATDQESGIYRNLVCQETTGSRHV